MIGNARLFLRYIKLTVKLITEIFIRHLTKLVKLYRFEALQSIQMQATALFEGFCYNTRMDKPQVIQRIEKLRDAPAHAGIDR